MKLEGEACFVNKTIHTALEEIGAKLIEIAPNNKKFIYRRFVSRAASCTTDLITIHLEKPLRWTIDTKNDVTQEIGSRREWQAYAAYDLSTPGDLAFFLTFFENQKAA